MWNSLVHCQTLLPRPSEGTLIDIQECLLRFHLGQEYPRRGMSSQYPVRTPPLVLCVTVWPQLYLMAALARSPSSDHLPPLAPSPFARLKLWNLGSIFRRVKCVRTRKLTYARPVLSSERSPHILDLSCPLAARTFELP